MSQILVTGGAGFIGSHLVDRLLNMGKKVICIDNFDPFYEPRIKKKNIEHNLENMNFTLINEDIRNKKKLEEIFEMHSIDKIVHLAARAGVRPSIRDPLLYEDVNIKGTLNLLELCKKYQIKNFIFGSSSSVYGINSKIVVVTPLFGLTRGNETQIEKLRTTDPQSYRDMVKLHSLNEFFGYYTFLIITLMFIFAVILYEKKMNVWCE